MKVRRRPVTDRVDRDGQCVVLVGHTVTRLSTLATLLLDGCDDRRWTDVDDLVAHLVRELGPPDEGMDAGQVVGTAVDELVALGLLERG